GAGDGLHLEVGPGRALDLVAGQLVLGHVGVEVDDDAVHVDEDSVQRYSPLVELDSMSMFSRRITPAGGWKPLRMATASSRSLRSCQPSSSVARPGGGRSERPHGWMK